MATALAAGVRRRRRFGGGSFASASSEGNRSFSSVAGLPPRTPPTRCNRVFGDKSETDCRRSGRPREGENTRTVGRAQTHTSAVASRTHTADGARARRPQQQRASVGNAALSLFGFARAPVGGVRPRRRPEPWTEAIVGVVGALFARVGETRSNGSSIQGVRSVVAAPSRCSVPFFYRQPTVQCTFFYHRDPPTVGRNGGTVWLDHSLRRSLTTGDRP